MNVLPCTTNPFNGVVILSESLPADPQVFEQRLTHSLAAWQKDGHLVVWLEVPIHLSDLIPVAVRSKFTFHHSSDDYLMLTHRLVEGAMIPGFATHYIGAGGVVLSERRELLVVSEKYRGSPEPSYKLPGGALHPGEHLAECVMREIFEETGVRTRFEALACLRHWHDYRYGKSDIYFVCRLQPLNYDLSVQADEIDQCLWMPVQEYLESPYVHVFNRKIVRAALNHHGVVPTSIAGYSDARKHEIFMPPNVGDR